MKGNIKAIYYDLWSRLVTHRIHEDIFRHLRETYTLPPQGWLLDIGCGTGGYSKKFTGQNYIGLESEISLAQLGMRKYKKNFVCQRADRLGFKDNSIDVVFCANVLHHLDDGNLEKMFTEVWRIAKKGGQIIIYDVYRKPGQSWLTRLAYDMDFGKHVRFLDDLKQIFGKGFRDFRLRFFSSSIYDYYNLFIMK